MTNNTLAVYLFFLSCHYQMSLPAVAACPSHPRQKGPGFGSCSLGFSRALGTLLWPMCRDSTGSGAFLRAGVKGMGFCLKGEAQMKCKVVLLHLLDFMLSVFLTEHRKGAEGDACHQLLAVKNPCKAGKGSLQLNTAPQRGQWPYLPSEWGQRPGRGMGRKGEEEERASWTLDSA